MSLRNGNRANTILLWTIFLFPLFIFNNSSNGFRYDDFDFLIKIFLICTSFLAKFPLLIERLTLSRPPFLLIWPLLPLSISMLFELSLLSWSELLILLITIEAKSTPVLPLPFFISKAETWAWKLLLEELFLLRAAGQQGMRYASIFSKLFIIPSGPSSFLTLASAARRAGSLQWILSINRSQNFLSSGT